MAKIEKTRLDFFPFDTDFFEDEKIVAVCSEFGCKGEIATVKLLCEVYRNGYYVVWNEPMRIKLVRKLSGISAGLLDQIVRRLVRWGFFDKTLFDTAHVLTSHGIQVRYFASYSRRSRKGLPYLLVDDAKTAVIAAKTPSKGDGGEYTLHFEDDDADGSVIAAETGVIDVKTAETGVFAAKTQVNDAGSTQKETKQNDIGDSLRSSMSEGEPPTQGKDSADSIDFDAFRDFFNGKVAGTSIPAVVSLKSEKRRGLLRARMKEYGKESLATVVQKAVDSNFLTGGTGQFVAKFDWIFRPQNFQKILEGNYDNKISQTSNGYGTNSISSYRPVARPTMQQRINEELTEAAAHFQQLIAPTGKAVHSGVSEEVW